MWQSSVSSSPRIKIQNLETSGEQPLSNIVAELFVSANGDNRIPAELTRKIPNKGKKWYLVIVGIKFIVEVNF